MKTMNSKAVSKIPVPYLVTVIISVLLLVIGHTVMVRDMFTLKNPEQVPVKAVVVNITDRVQAESDTTIVFEARISGGAHNGEIVKATHIVYNVLRTGPREAAEGDTVMLVKFGDVWFFNGYVRANKLIGLGILFVVCVLIFGRKKGFNTILSLGLTCIAVFAVFIPSILSGKNIYIMAALVCVYTTITTLLIVSGFNKKTLAAVIGCISGIMITGMIAIVMDQLLRLTGIVDEQSRTLVNLPLVNPVNLKAIIFAGIIIGAMGAIMDVAMSISSSLWEVKEKAGTIPFDALFRSGLNIGRDILGSMANTLVLAYIGSSLSVVLILTVYSNSLMELINREMIVVEILQALAGIFGILAAMPLTAFFSAKLYLKKRGS